MPMAGMRKLCRFCLAAVVAGALCALTLVDVPPQLTEPPTDSPPTRDGEEHGARSIVAYSWARRLALDHRPSIKCPDPIPVTLDDDKSAESSSRVDDARSRSPANDNKIDWSKIDEAKRRHDWLETIPRRLFLYSAHLDVRVAGYPSVRVIGVKRETSRTTTTTKTTLYCTIWHKDVDGTTKSFSMEALVSKIWLDEWGGSTEDYTGTLITCQLPLLVIGVSRVHVGEKSCHRDPSHSLSINVLTRMRNATTTRTRKNDEFALCIKGLDFDEDISEKLIAFIEINRILGAGVIYIYVFNVHENVSRILRIYEKSNVVRWFRIELPGDLPKSMDERRDFLSRDLWTKRRMELIPYNHCFYENLYTADFVVPLDIDETILPIKRDNWRDLMNDVKNHLGGPSYHEYASYAVRNAYFFTEMQLSPLTSNSTTTCGFRSGKIENCIYLDVVRSSIISPIGDSVKSFVSTARALTVHNHYALTTLNPSVRRAYHLDTIDALKHHHRRCDKRHHDCRRMMKLSRIDKTALRYTAELEKRVKIFHEKAKNTQLDAR